MLAPPLSIPHLPQPQGEKLTPVQRQARKTRRQVLHNEWIQGWLISVSIKKQELSKKLHLFPPKVYIHL